MSANGTHSPYGQRTTRRSRTRGVCPPPPPKRGGCQSNITPTWGVKGLSTPNRGLEELQPRATAAEAPLPARTSRRSEPHE